MFLFRNIFSVIELRTDGELIVRRTARRGTRLAE